jgi:6,7-dimethyl-8-ribityllumazine synthase
MIHDLKIEKVDLTAPERLRIAIIQSTYHAELNGNMASCCRQVLVENGVPDANVDVLYAAGTWEIALLASEAAKSGRYHGIVAFGIIIKGETYHFDLIADQVARSLMDTSVGHGIPVAFEILAVYEEQQAVARASLDRFNKGLEAGNAVLKTIAALQTLPWK